MLRKADFAFDLPPDRIAQAPAATRDASRLLVVGDPRVDARFTELAAHLPAGAVVVVNDARVVRARVPTRKASGGAIELFFLEPQVDVPIGPGRTAWRALAKGAVTVGQVLTAVRDPAVQFTIAASRADDGTLAVAAPASADPYAFLEQVGELPLPHYIERPAGPSGDDAERYQTMFARTPGAVAAPTAGLHMTPAVAASLAARDIAIAPLTLHVGLGTFAPVRTDDLDQHRMHTERFDIPAATAALVASGRPVVALGTTAVRALEAAATGDHQVRPGPGSTDLFIRPDTGFRFRVVDVLITNFHLPESTLLMLVTAFGGYDRVMAAYRHAVGAGYRFFSYGDAMVVGRAP